jgi:hypothetical protein
LKVYGVYPEESTKCGDLFLYEKQELTADDLKILILGYFEKEIRCENDVQARIILEYWINMLQTITVKEALDWYKKQIKN